jgi:hypothetical protein
MDAAPIALFAYNRPEHLERTVRSLQANELAPQTSLHVFSDGPRSTVDVAKVETVRAFARTIAGFGDVQVICREENLGGPAGIPLGISEVCARHGRVIVVEDDLEFSPAFLTYLNEALTMYAADPLVAAVSGFSFPHRRLLPETFFLRGAYSEGWGTWEHQWAVRDDDAARLSLRIQEEGLAEAFDLRYGPRTELLRSRPDGRLAPWDIRWHASAFLDGKLTLLPNVSLVRNIGFDGSGTNVGVGTNLEMPLSATGPHVKRVPTIENPVARAAFARLLRAQAGRKRRLLLSLPGGYRLGHRFAGRRAKRTPAAAAREGRRG